MQREIYDVTIIGGGPAGLFSAFYSGLRELKTKIIESEPRLGGKLNVYTEKMVWDIGALPPTPGGRVIDYLVEQAEVFNPTIVLSQKAIGIDKEEGVFVVTTETGAKHYSKTLIMASGWGVLLPNKITVEDSEKYEATNLHYLVKDPQVLSGKKVLVSGGGNSAVDWVNILAPLTEEVTLVYRQAELKAHESQVSKLLAGQATYKGNHTITRFIADSTGERIAEVVLTDNLTGVETIIAVDEVVINHGYSEEGAIFDKNTVGLEKHDDFYVQTSFDNQSDVPGIFAAGDVVSHSGKLHLIAGAFHDAGNAVNQVKKYIEPEAHSHGRVSSHNHKFDEKNIPLKAQFFG